MVDRLTPICGHSPTLQAPAATAPAALSRHLTPKDATVNTKQTESVMQVTALTQPEWRLTTHEIESVKADHEVNLLPFDDRGEPIKGRSYTTEDDYYRSAGGLGPYPPPPHHQPRDAYPSSYAQPTAPHYPPSSFREVR